MNSESKIRTSWFEDLPQNYFVEVIAIREGEWDFNCDKNIVKKRFTQLPQLNDFKRSYQKHNLFRSLTVYKDEEGSESIGKIPIVLDIDSDNLRNPDLGATQKATIQSVELLLGRTYPSSLQENDIRVVFSGYKGFHIELRLNYCFACELREWLKKKMRNLNGLREDGCWIAPNVMVDPINEKHRHVRIKDTRNSWTNSSGNIKHRKCIELSHQELINLNINQIVDRATE